MGTLQGANLTPQTAEEREIAALDPWFHNLHLPSGVQTAPHHPLGDFPAFKWQALAPHLPPDLSGWRVLDVGCNSGYYSFALAQRGAEVDAVDADPHYLRQARWAARLLDPAHRCHFRQLSVYALAHEPTTYDLVWFMGVFYHLRYPLLALDILARKTSRLLVFQSLSVEAPDPGPLPPDLDYAQREQMNQAYWPRLSFIEGSFAGDSTNWWVPNTAVIPALLRSAGLHPLEQPLEETWLCRPAPQRPLNPELQQIFPAAPGPRPGT